MLLRSELSLPPTALILCATAPLSPQLAMQAQAALNGHLVEIYGCTEAGQIASRRTAQEDTWETFGALRVACEPDNEATGTTAFFTVNGGHVTQPTPLADVLDIESPTRFRLLGRANDLIHVAGKRSSLAHLNFHLNRIDGVEDGAFWLPDDAEAAPETVTRPVAFVVAPALSAQEIILALRRSIEPIFVPRIVVHVAALPREATGKLTAQALRCFALRHLDKS
jgi:acyl-coenzyme A synthetase/AMP-(fatty) acid ligase